MRNRRQRAGRRRILPWIAVALLVVPTLEIAVIVRVGTWIGAWPTLGLLIIESALGAWIVKRQGARSWAALREALADRRLPATELADAALVLIGGVLLLSPGFVTDIAGFLLVLPWSRRLVRPLLGRAVAARLIVAPVAAAGSGRYGSRVVPGEIIDPQD